MLDDIFYVLSSKKPDYLVIEPEVYEVLGNWWCFETFPASLDMCKVHAKCSHASIIIQYNEHLPDHIIEKRGKKKRHCTWQVLLSSDALTTSYHFATREGFSQVIPIVLKDLITIGKDTKYNKKSFVCYYQGS